MCFIVNEKGKTMKKKTPQRDKTQRGILRGIQTELKKKHGIYFQ